jgi:molybdopterin/thiamine biosynthesis adenylyltransferase
LKRQKENTILVQAGAGNGATLVLVDPEPLVAANLGRHLLNFEDVGKMKADALAAALKKFHPDVQVRPITSRIESIWQTLQDFDLIVDATGMELTSEFINAEALKLRSSGRSCSVLHAFLFANGISARTLLNVGEGHAACQVAACGRRQQDQGGWPGFSDSVWHAGRGGGLEGQNP